MDLKILTQSLFLCHLLYYPVNAHRSSGRLIIDAAKKAYEKSVVPNRHRRDASSSINDGETKLESLLLPDPSNAHVVEFDLILDDDQYGTLKTVGENYNKYSKTSHRQKRKAVRHSIYHWPGAEVPYKIHSSVDAISSQARYRIKKAFTHWEKYTCVKFVEYNPIEHRNYVIIQKGQWCASKLGMAGGPQPLYLALGCLDTGTIIHELGHSLGWVHEQARPDRDEYVSIKWSLISPNYKSQYVKHDNDYINTYGVPYDYGSIMHYPSYGELITNDPSQQSKIGQRNRLSFNDIKLANIMYNCAARSECDTKKFKCINGGFVDHTCKCVCPDGNSRSCTVSSTGYKYTPNIIDEKTTPKSEVCSPWVVYDNAYIPGYNEDVGFSLSIEECQTRCMHETSFKCRSFDYWKNRRQCYLSSTSATGLGIKLRHDSRMVHYMLTECPSTTTKLTTITPSTPDARLVKRTPLYGKTTSNPLVVYPRLKRNSCPFEYTNTGMSCVWAVEFPARPVHIAEIECQNRLGAKLWEPSKQELKSPSLYTAINEGEEYWVKVDQYKSTNVMASFFEFCPFITRVHGRLLIKDTLCYKSKGYFCQLKK